MKRIYLCLTCLMMISCGENSEAPQIITDLYLESFVDHHGDTTVGGAVEFNFEEGTGFYVSGNIPIYNKKKKELGTISFLNKKVLSFSMNLTNTANFSYGDGLLPNGRRIPYRVKPRDVIELPIGESNSAYISVARGVSLIGFALNLEGLNESSVNADIFFSFAFGDIKGLVGYFGPSLEEGFKKGGIALFVEISSIIPPSALMNITEGILPETTQKGFAYNPDFDTSILNHENTQNVDTADLLEIWGIIENTELTIID